MKLIQKRLHLLTADQSRRLNLLQENVGILTDSSLSDYRTNFDDICHVIDELKTFMMEPIEVILIRNEFISLNRIFGTDEIRQFNQDIKVPSWIYWNSKHRMALKARLGI